MKRIYLFLSAFFIVLSSCDNELDVNSDWEEVTVVFGLLDAGVGKELQQVRINKAFLGQMSALDMAQYTDSINFTDSLHVMIYRIKNGIVKDSIVLVDSIVLREGGLFSDTTVVYSFINNDFLKSNSNYELVVKNTSSGNRVSAYTNIISDFSWGVQFKPFYNIGFYKNDLSDFDDKQINWNNVNNGKIYQLNVEFNYSEEDINTGIKSYHSIDWLHPMETYTSGEMSTKLEGEQFFNFLQRNIVKDNTIERTFESIYVEMTVGTEELETYINVNKPITGIVQQRPQYSNIINGIGLFSSRYTHRDQIINMQDMSNKGLTDATHFYIINELDRNFSYSY